MLARPLLSRILRDEALTRRLGDPEARLLVEWLVDQAERLAGAAGSEGDGRQVIERLCRRGRAIAHFVGLWCYETARAAAIQLAATERFYWPLPSAATDPCDLMQSILTWEARHLLPAPIPATSS